MLVQRVTQASGHLGYESGSSLRWDLLCGDPRPTLLTPASLSPTDVTFAFLFWVSRLDLPSQLASQSDTCPQVPQTSRGRSCLSLSSRYCPPVSLRSLVPSPTKISHRTALPSFPCPSPLTWLPDLGMSCPLLGPESASPLPTDSVVSIRQYFPKSVPRVPWSALYSGGFEKLPILGIYNTC